MKHILAILRELFSKKLLEREIEKMVMTGEQVLSYSAYGEADSALRAAYLFHAYWASQSFSGCKRVIDLGCGPANQLLLLAKLNPQIHFVGVDLSEDMLKLAQKNKESSGINNVEFVADDITQLSKLADKSFDGVFSSVALHHVSTEKDLYAVFSQVERVLSGPRALYITDFILLKNPKSIDYLLELNWQQPELFRLEYLNSLKAAFSLVHFKKVHELVHTDFKIYHTKLANFLMIMKTPSLTSEENMNFSQLFNDEVRKLSIKNLQTYRDLSLMFSVSGLK